MSSADPADPEANVLLGQIGDLTFTAIAGVIVSLVRLYLAERQRTRDEKQTEARRPEAVLAAFGSELPRNRAATCRKLDASNAHVMVWALTGVAFEHHADPQESGAPCGRLTPAAMERENATKGQAAFTVSGGLEGP